MITFKINKINKKYSIIILLCFLLLFLLCIIYFKINNKIKIKSKSNFYNMLQDEVNRLKAPVTTAMSQEDSAKARGFGPDGPPEMGTVKSCESSSDIVGVCMDYNTCCSDSASKNSCFCSHPFTLSCKTKYDECMNDPNNKSIYNTKKTLTEKCSADNSDCCKVYNNIPIKSSNFTEPTNNLQTDNILCNVSLIKNLNNVCTGLCQTNPKCAAYSIKGTSCNLFTFVSPHANNINPSVNFYTKIT